MSTAEQSKKRRDTLKHLKRCVICGKTDAYTLNGRACCAECCEKQKKYNQNINKEKAQQRKKKLYEERKLNHLCVHCGKALPDDYKYTNCEKCRAKLIQACERNNRKNGVFPRDTSLCHHCQKKPPLKYKKVCADCYEKLCKNLEYGRKFVNKNQNQFYLNQNKFYSGKGRKIMYKMSESERNEIIKRKQQAYLKEFDTSDMENCEFIEEMKKSYLKPPNQLNGKCEGYRNPYTGNLSIICNNCSHKKEVN